MNTVSESDKAFRCTPRSARKIFTKMLGWISSVDPAPQAGYIGWALPRAAFSAILLNRYAGARQPKVLDIGSDPHFAYLISRACPSVTLIPTAIECTQQILRAPDFFYRYDPIQLQLTPGRCNIPCADIVTMWEVLEHLPWNPALLLGSIGEAINNSGLLLLSTPNLGGVSPVVRALGGASPHQTPLLKDGLMQHRKEYAVWELKELFRWAGFNIVHYETADLYFSDTRSWTRLTYRAFAAIAAGLTGSPVRLRHALYHSGSTHFIAGHKSRIPQWNTPPIDV